VQPYPGPGPRQQVSRDGGSAPAWSADGQELFYTVSGLPPPDGGTPVVTVMAVPVTVRPGFTAGVPRVLFEGRYMMSGPVRGYDVTRDGRRFVMIQNKERPPIKVTQMVLVQNWLDELRRRAPTR
jgi:hypothetical protein